MTGARVPTTRVLECLQQVLHEHQWHVDAVVKGFVQSPLLLALTFDESERLRPLLDQVLRAEEGLLVDAANFADRVPLDGDPGDIADLAVAVQAALTEINQFPRANEDLRLVIDTETVSITGATEFADA